MKKKFVDDGSALGRPLTGVVNGEALFREWLHERGVSKKGDISSQALFQEMLIDLWHFAHHMGWDLGKLTGFAGIHFRIDLEICDHCQLEFEGDDLKSAYLTEKQCRKKHAKHRAECQDLRAV